MIPKIVKRHIYKRIPDRLFIKWKYFLVFKKFPNLDNPQTLNEKIQWLKIHDRNPKCTVCADKLMVREIIKEKIGEEYLIPLEFTTRNPEDISPTNLPNHPVIIKTNHNSSGGVIVYEKDSIKWDAVKKKLKSLLKENYYYLTKEWQYHNIQPSIIVERLLLDSKNRIPSDIKFHCFHGKVEVIQVDIDRFDAHNRNIYSRDWQELPFYWIPKSQDGSLSKNFRRPNIEKPNSLDTMIYLAETLAEEFPYVRVDLYNMEGKIFFGELTFHHGSGLERIVPQKFDYILGKKLHLPIISKD